MPFIFVFTGDLGHYLTPLIPPCSLFIYVPHAIKTAISIKGNHVANLYHPLIRYS